MHQQRNFYTLLIIIVVFIAAVVVDASSTVPGFPTFAPAIRQGVDLQGGLRVLYQATIANPPSDTMSAALNILEERVNGLGVSEPVLNLVGNNRISVELPGVKNTDAVLNLLGGTGQLTINNTGSTVLNPGDKVTPKQYPVEFYGKDIKPGSAQAGFDSTNQPIVTFNLQSGAADAFAKYTADNVGQHMAIAMDGVVVTDPVIESAITGGAVEINGGNMTYTEAQNIALQLKYGALPVSLKTVDIQQVSATLGPANVQASIKAGIIGLFIVVLFMLIYYRLPGLLADLALLLYSAVVFAIFKIIGVTLTLEGIAGFILSIGMAVDANVLIFERLKEELRAGKSLGAAIDAGFARAWTSIRDSNISTMLTCAVLFIFGQDFAASIIVGFATTLFLGVLVSMITAIFVTRTFLRALIGSAAGRGQDGGVQRSWFGVGV